MNSDFFLQRFVAKGTDRISISRPVLLLLLTIGLTACATPRLQEVSPVVRPPVLLTDHALMEDGYSLPLSRWGPDSSPRAVVLALHGFNDYRKAFATLGPVFAAAGIVTYAIDQRGFGATEQRGLWPGDERLQEDVRNMIRLLREHHPGLPLFLLGESMGGAVIMKSLHAADTLQADGVILVAPAVWGWHSMPLLQRAALWLLAHTMPAYRATAKGLDITPSDNREMLLAQGRDPLVIKETRIDAVYGLTGLMDEALMASPRLTLPALILYGEMDDVIPKPPTCRMLDTLPDPLDGDWRLALYAQGYHMLTRDLQAEVVLKDMLAWLEDHTAALPSAQEVTMTSPRLQRLCKRRPNGDRPL